MEPIDLKKIRRNMFGIPTTKNICRSLFGEVDHEEVKRDLEREYQETLQQKSMLWNFDFDNYCPRDGTRGLKWIPEVAQVTEHTIKTGCSLVTSHRDGPFVEKRVLQQQSNVLLPTSSLTQQKHRQHQTSTKTETKQTCIKDFTTTKNKTLVSTDDEVNVIEIITESPTRNITKENVSPISFNSTVATKLDISENTRTHGKRKRILQPTIDGIYTIIFYLFLCDIFVFVKLLPPLHPQIVSKSK